jgi:hypothetical protein
MVLLSRIPGLEDEDTFSSSSSMGCCPLPLPDRVLVRSGSRSTADNAGLPIPKLVSLVILGQCPCPCGGDTCHTRFDQGEVSEEGKRVVMGTKEGEAGAESGVQAIDDEW